MRGQTLVRMVEKGATVLVCDGAVARTRENGSCATAVGQKLTLSKTMKSSR